MKSALVALGVMGISLIAVAGARGRAHAQTPVPMEDIGVDPAIPLPAPDPCGACGYAVASKQFSGVLDPTYTAHPYPLTNMTLKLYNNFGALLAGPISLSPSSAYGSQNMSQTVSTSVTSGVARAVFSYTAADGHNGSHTVTVQ